MCIRDRCYDSYLPAIRLAGGTAVPVPLRAPTADDPYYRIDWQRVRDAITSKTRLLMLNFPHNPTGAVLDLSLIHIYPERSSGGRLLGGQAVPIRITCLLYTSRCV